MHHQKVLLLLLCMGWIVNSLLTHSMLKKKLASRQILAKKKNEVNIDISTTCKTVDLTSTYAYTGIVRSGYLTVGKGNSALAFTFYGRKGVTAIQDLKLNPTIIWLQGGPGSSSQFGNLQELGPLLIQDRTKVVNNQNTWALDYNLLFVDQPVGTGLSYADTTLQNSSFVTSMQGVAEDFYYALNQLYNNGDGCFSSKYLNIPGSSSFFIFGQSYAGKYVPAIAKKILQQQIENGFLTGLKGVGIGDGFTYPEKILSEVGSYAFHLSLIDYQERMGVEQVLLRAKNHQNNGDYKALHQDFDTVLDYIVQKSQVNVYDIRIDGQYKGKSCTIIEYVQPYFLNAENIALYQLNPAIIYDSQSQQVYNALYEDFMKPEVNSVQFLLAQGLNVLLYNGQDDLIVQSAGSMKWIDEINYDQSQTFKQMLFSAWKIDNKVVGSIKKAGKLQFRIVNNAGHMVPKDRPVESLNMVRSFVLGVLNAGQSNIGIKQF